MSEHPNCNTCRFASVEIRPNDSEGNPNPTPFQSCRRYPPAIVSYLDPVPTTFGGHQSFFGQSYPTVDDGEWCGEYQERPES